MITINATVRNGQIELDEPLDLPDGTKLLIPLPTGPDAIDQEEEDGWDNSPEGIAAWLKWYDSLQPLIFTKEERAAWDADRQSRQEWEKSHFEEHAEKLRRMWKAAAKCK